MSAAAGSMPQVERVVAVDWSGDRSAAGQRKKIWAAVWSTTAAGRVQGGSVRLESGRTRSELADCLIEMSHETPRMVVGIDCCFSFPAWFLAEHRCTSVFALWKSVAEGRGEEWLHRECSDARFWGVAGSGRTGKRPVEFSGDGLRRMLRTTDWENKIAVREDGGDSDRAARMRGITAKSPFQIGGRGSVGTGSLRAMPILQRMRESGFRVWPFESAEFAGTRPGPLLVEMYTRLLTGPVAKRNADARRAYLATRREIAELYAGLSRGVLAKACESEDAFDALVSCMEMVRCRDEFSSLRATSDELLRLEGITWHPGVQ